MRPQQRLRLPLLFALLASLPAPACSPEKGATHEKATGPSDPITLLRELFPAQAKDVLEGCAPFIERMHGFGLPDSTAAGPPPRLPLLLPFQGEDAARFDLPAGGPIEVRELGAHGEGDLLSGAVVYARSGGASFWKAAANGHEEWLLLTPGAPAASWQVAGASLRARGESVDIVDPQGVLRLIVTAPSAFTTGRAPITARLLVDGDKLLLLADTRGEPALLATRWSVASPLQKKHDGPAATLLLDGRVLLTGGDTSTAEIYDPDANQWLPAPSLSLQRRDHAATRLPDGRVLFTGGRVVVAGDHDEYLRDVVLYDPAAEARLSGAPMLESRAGHQATLLEDGRVLVTGGEHGSGSGNVRSSVELYDPGPGLWIKKADMHAPRSYHTATRLADGRVLVAGGLGSKGATLGAAEIYDPAQDTWTEITMIAARHHHAAARLPDGRVLITGGMSWGNPLASAEAFDPGTSTWSPAPTMYRARVGHTMTVTPAEALVIGGHDGDSVVKDAERLPLASGAVWRSAGVMTAGRHMHTATLLVDGHVLVAGGLGEAAANTLGTVELLAPGAGIGEPCATRTDCSSGHCVDGVCCNVACGSPACTACTAVRGAPQDGICTYLNGACTGH